MGVCEFDFIRERRFKLDTALFRLIEFSRTDRFSWESIVRSTG